MITCHSCRFKSPDTANFCAGCGARIAASEYISPVHSVGSGSSRHPDGDPHSEGTLRYVTVMFADIFDSSAFVNENDPETAQETLDSVIEIMIHGVHEYGGTVAQVLGDGILAMFGAPVAYEDHATRACLAALDIQEKIQSRKNWPAGMVGKRPQIRIGLNSGEVLVSTIRNDVSVDYRAVGSTTHIASRLEQLARPGTTILTSQTLRLARGHVLAEEIGSPSVKGFDEPIRVYELLGRTDLSRFQVLMSRGQTRFCGRQSEMDSLSQEYANLLRGGSRVVDISGEPGIGKSRLIYEFLQRHTGFESVVVEIECPSQERTPYSAIRNFIRGKIGIVASDSPDKVVEKTTRHFESKNIDQKSVRPLLALLGIDQRDTEWSFLEPPQRRNAMFEAFREFILDTAGGKPLLLMCEDLHWFDRESLEFVTELYDGYVDKQVMFLFTRRPYWNPGHKVDRKIVLEPLVATDLESLITALVGNADRALLVEVSNLCAGNPLFVEEIVRSLVENDYIMGQSGAYERTNHDSAVEVPPSVESVIAARFDKLPGNVRDILTTISVAGNVVTIPLLAYMLNRDPGELETILDEAEKLGFIIVERRAPETNCQFRHMVFKEVLYNGLLRSTRAQRHAEVGNAIEQLYGRNLQNFSDELVVHFYHGKQWMKSAEYSLVAASTAAERSANQYAWETLETGLESIGKLNKDDQEVIKLGVDLRLAALSPLLPLGDLDRAVGIVEEAEILAGTLGDTNRMGAVYSQMATALWFRSDHAEAKVVTQKAMAIAEKENNLGLRMRSAYNLGMVLHSQADYEQAISVYSQLLAAIPDSERRKRYGWVGNPEVFCRTFMASALAYTGLYSEAEDCFLKGEKLADDVRHPYSQALIKEEIGFFYLQLGEPGDAIERLREAEQISAKHEVSTMIAPIAARLVDTLCALGQLDEAAKLVKQAFDSGSYRHSARYGLNFLYLALANVEYHQGHRSEAIAAAVTVEEWTRKSQENGHNVLALIELGKAYSLDPNRYRDATYALEKASRHADKFGMKSYVAESAYLMGRLLHKEGQLEKSRNCFDEAHKRYSQLGLEKQERKVLSAISESF